MYEVTGKKAYIMDLEVYPNYFLAAFKNYQTSELILFDTQTKFKKKQIKKIRKIVDNCLIVTFNGLRYDIPMLNFALLKNDTQMCFDQSTQIIMTNGSVYQTYQRMRIRRPLEIDHIDLFEVAPGVGVGLKLYGSRMGSKKLWDLPYEPGTILKKKQIDNLRLYCVNDLDTTIDLFNALKEQLELRHNMSNEYKTDLRSKSDAQIAESVFYSEFGGNV
jgi:hypothetical protein